MVQGMDILWKRFVRKYVNVRSCKKKEEVNICAMSDLEACYDRQIPELCGLA